MEAEEPHTTMDAEEHPSSKDPSAEDSQEPPLPDTPLEPFISQIPLEPHTSGSQMMSPTSHSELETYTSENPLEPSISEPPLELITSESQIVPSTSQTEFETYTSENPLEPSISEPPLEPHTSESQMMSPTSHTELETYTSENPLEPSISEPPLELNTSESHMMPSTSQTPLETYTSENPLEPSVSKASVEHSISNVPEEYSTLQNSSPDQVSDALKKGLSSEVSWPRRSTQIRESEMLPKHSLVGPSAKVHLDTFEKEREEEGEDKEGEDATVSTTHTAQPGRHLGKKKEKKGVSRDTASPVVPAKQAEQVGVPKTMHREKFGAQANNLFQWEKNAALKATQTGLYIGWRCPHYLWDCFRIGDESRCFCGHLLREHRVVSDISVPCNVSQCRCLMFCFIPSRPEEVACDRRWEEHETFFETEETRRRGGRPRGTDTVNSWHRPV
ncbi:protein FAM221B isoform X4 [Eptesicus fuscus]|uniref:protein FAM221B isoform X4 n=1 Tax=Eptesicus fuscus TaxID=29078 RepID=UPI002403D8E5|nr:protein FAM221B isoform X4 [Eptesicus fuscus]